MVTRERMDTQRRSVSEGEGVPAFPGSFGRCFACIYFDTVKISCLLRDTVTPQKATWTATSALPAGSGHVITQRLLASSGPCPQQVVPAKPEDSEPGSHQTLPPTWSWGSLKNWENGREVESVHHMCLQKGPKKMSEVKKQKHSTRDIISGWQQQKEPRSPPASFRNHRTVNPSDERLVWRQGKDGTRRTVTVPTQGAERQALPPAWRTGIPECPVCQLHSRAPLLPCPDGAKAAVMTSRSAKSKHSPHFFHGQVLTPNCQHRPPNNPNGKLPFPRK